MEYTIANLRHTNNNKAAGVTRIFVGLLILLTGLMKFFVPMLRNAWSGQLIQASIPFYTFNFWVVPVVEIIIGSLVVVGLFSRFGSLVVVSIMLAATYVHLVAHDPTLFPLQPKAPIIPLILIAIGAYILWRGAGAWSLDLRFSKARN